MKHIKNKVISGILLFVLIAGFLLVGLQGVNNPVAAGPRPTNAPTESPVFLAYKGVNITTGAGPSYSWELKESTTAWVRVDLVWRRVEPNADGNYIWDTRFENDLAAIVTMRKMPLIIINSPPVGYLESGSGSCRPIKAQHIDELGDFVYAAVNRYKSDVKYWEILNEPDLKTGALGDSGGYGCYGNYKYRYRDLFNEAYTRGKNADSNAEFLIGGISFADCDNHFNPAAGTCHSADWMEWELDNISTYDGLSFHFYHYSSGTGPGDTTVSMSTFWNYLTSEAGSTPLYWTEAGLQCVGGVSVCTASYFENLQADHAETCHMYADYYDLDGWMWYVLNPNGWRYVDMIINPGRRKKPVYWAFAALGVPWSVFTPPPSPR